MSQLLLPLFPSDTQLLTPYIGVREYEGQVHYLLNGLPIYSHSKSDHMRFRYITSHLALQGLCKNQDIVDLFHVSHDSVRRWKKKLSEEGESVFFGVSEGRHGHCSKLFPDVLSRIQSEMDTGKSVYSIAKREGISEGSIRYWIKEGRLKKNSLPDSPSLAVSRSTRSHQDAQAGEALGIAATRIEERALAVTGEQVYARSLFESNESVENGGVLFALPALFSQGLDKFFTAFRNLPNGFYGLHHILLLLCFMALCRIKNVEQLKKTSVGELGKLLGLDRIPQVEYLRKKIKQITDQQQCDSAQQTLFTLWQEKMSGLFFYIDGHVRVYSGKAANLPKHYVSRQKLCLSATTEFYVNTFEGLPLMVIHGELNERLKDAIEKVIPAIKETVTASEDSNKPLFTLVFDREAYEPGWFIKLWKAHRIAIISYRKNVKDKWDDNMFEPAEIQLYNNNVTVHVCEMGSLIQGHWFREIRKLSESGHQTAIITTHPTLAIQQIAGKMFARWGQENFFKYMAENFDFDRMMQYGTESLGNKDASIPNPEYKDLTYKIKKMKEKCARLQAQLFRKLDPTTPESNQIHKIIAQNLPLAEQITDYTKDINDLLAQRKGVPSRITIKNMPQDKQYNKLIEESKKLKNLILMLAYRAESALYCLLPEYYNNAKKDGRQILKEIFTSCADLIPDYQNQILYVKLHTLNTPRANGVAINLCAFLNDTNTVFPMTNLKLIYEMVAP